VALIGDYLSLKAKRDFAQSDALRREMTIAGPFELYEHKDGVEFIVVNTSPPTR
jgi:hypothetical protein